VGGPVSQRDGLLLLEKSTTTTRRNVPDITYGLEGFLQLVTAFPFENEIMTTMYAMERVNSV
jgi:hypothetical protein